MTLDADARGDGTEADSGKRAPVGPRRALMSDCRMEKIAVVALGTTTIAS